MSRTGDKIYLQASPCPNTRKVPYIKTEMYISCFHPPSNQYRWFCFMFQLSGKDVHARHRGSRGRRCEAAGPYGMGGCKAGWKRNTSQHLVHSIWSDLREGAPPDCCLLPRGIYLSRFCLSILRVTLLIPLNLTLRFFPLFPSCTQDVCGFNLLCMRSCVGRVTD